MVHGLNPADERRHRATSDRWWGETWRFDAVDVSGVGLFVQFTVLPRQKACWFIAALARPGKDIIVCQDTDAVAPASSVIEIRSGALWSHAICETPMQHWTVAMEAYALELSDPADAWTNPMGNRIGLAFDLEWECVGDPAGLLDCLDTGGSGGQGYEVPAAVSGELRTEDERWLINASGSWSHRWNDRGDGWAEQIKCSGHGADIATACWLSPGPHGATRVWRHLVSDRWCSGTDGTERTVHI